MIRTRPIATVAIAAVGLATAVWLPTRFDQASATENGSTVVEQVFADEFNGDRGDDADASKWSTDGRAVRLDGEGHLVISAVTDSRSSRNRTAEAGLQTLKTFTAPGEVKARVKVADGQSVRSVFRLLGADSPALDVMENRGDRSAVVRAALGEGVDGRVEADESLAEDFHEYGVRFTVDGDIIWTLDGDEFLRAEDDLTEPFAVSLELSVPVGDGDGRRSRTSRTRSDQSQGTSMKVDFVRVSVEREAEEPPAEPTTPPTTPPTTEPTKPPTTEPTKPPTTQPPATTPWAPFRQLKAGDLVTFGGKTYKVNESHTSLPGWEPPVLTPDLFTLVS
ncbi:carbohydrate-binding protein [Actinoplanes sp. NPDC051633]|uniref:carbohydrate-binding protein n=1 Tax=Actinoplanes sp. NPDC051633 TaxID=3155670 RepID=UPI00342E7264